MYHGNIFMIVDLTLLYQVTLETVYSGVRLRWNISSHFICDGIEPFK